jgi:hypothetical protein
MEKKLIDDAFYVEQKRYGLWDSTDKDGKGLVTSLTEESCISATRFYLKFRQENQFESQNNEENVSKYSGSVDYKL